MRLEMLNIKKEYNGKIILDIDRLTLEKGRIYAVLGPNGSGKTTMLRIMAGIDGGYSGSVSYGNMEKPKHKEIAYMPQNVYLFDLTVMENVKTGIVNRQNDSGLDERIEFALDCVGMSRFKNRKARSLSGGEAQRVALARTLVLERSLVFLDEPASATDISGIELIENYIKSVNEKDGATIVMTTHSPSQAARIADEVIMMNGGKVIERGNPKGVLTAPVSQETKDFLKNWRI